MNTTPTVSIRFEPGSTDYNATVLIETINDFNTKKVIFLASPNACTENRTDSDGPSTNYPLLSALVLYEIPNITSTYILFDGIFLTAQRHPRYHEVRAVLDVAENSGKAFFVPERFDFTSGIPAEKAVDSILSMDNLIKLNSKTRPEYFALLSAVGEEALQTD